jgi:tRNA/tmRNA/rRNA uracil-C5-methylase (TrmA/RlmC/RlmD family)
MSTASGAFVEVIERAVDAAIRKALNLSETTNRRMMTVEEAATDWVAKFTDPAETVLDSFMGSGTTGIACAKLGPKFIGIEKRPDYFNLACRCIAEANRQHDMFAPTGS